MCRVCGHARVRRPPNLYPAKIEGVYFRFHSKRVAKQLICSYWKDREEDELPSFLLEACGDRSSEEEVDVLDVIGSSFMLATKLNFARESGT